ncbi:hypothetical protein ACFYXD_35435 [Streptomyces platensis]|uniref:hypothetical protein n=1 Tax=Streptomyces platensis TaxID=58346 RepID=UPI0036B34A39
MFLSATPQPPDLVQPTVGDIKSETARVWAGRDATKRLGAHLTPWTNGTAADGAPLVSARVLGPHAEEAMRLFANGLDPLGPVERCPQLDYSMPGVVALARRRAGVWVRLWATDTAAPPAPTPLSMPARMAPLPSGRLPYRRNTTTKEN